MGRWMGWLTLPACQPCPSHPPITSYRLHYARPEHCSEEPHPRQERHEPHLPRHCCGCDNPYVHVVCHAPTCPRTHPPHPPNRPSTLPLASTSQPTHRPTNLPTHHPHSHQLAQPPLSSTHPSTHTPIHPLTHTPTHTHTPPTQAIANGLQHADQSAKYFCRLHS